MEQPYQISSIASNVTSNPQKLAIVEQNVNKVMDFLSDSSTVELESVDIEITTYGLSLDSEAPARNGAEGRALSKARAERSGCGRRG